MKKEGGRRRQVKRKSGRRKKGEDGLILINVAQGRIKWRKQFLWMEVLGSDVKQ